MNNHQSGTGRGRAGLLRCADLRGVVLRGLVPVALGLVMLWQVTATYHEFNATYDEPYHIAAGPRGQPAWAIRQRRRATSASAVGHWLAAASAWCRVPHGLPSQRRLRGPSCSFCPVPA